MDARKSHFMSLIWASIVIIFFSVVATIMIVRWSPILSEAVAADMNDANDKKTSAFLPYIALHQTVSRHSIAVLDEFVATEYCPK